MPLVFVHGVATREGSEYRETEAARNELFKRLALDGIARGPVEILSPYWGGSGAEPAWGLASVPGGEYESLGGDEMTAAVALAETTDRIGSSDEEILLAVARGSLEAAIDLLWVMAATGAEGTAAEELGRLALRAQDYAAHNPKPDWLERAQNDAQFLRDLQVHVGRWKLRDSAPTAEEAAEWESLGASEIWERIREGGSRLKGGVGRLAGRGLVNLGREKVQGKLVGFLGDIFVYLAKRGEKDDPGDIPKTVIGAIEEAARKRTAEDLFLILVGHSMGGNILYDVLSHFRPDIQVDALVTVGSQPGLFQELRLFKERYEDRPGEGGNRVPKPPSVKHWINIFDDQDLLAFVTEPVFEGTRDLRFSTGTGVHGAHSTYFERPSFHRRLRDRLKEALLTAP